MSAQDSLVSLVFLPFVIPIAIWVAVSDLATMKIRNKAVMAQFLVFALAGAGLAAYGAWDWMTYGWRYVHLVVVLIIGFVMNAVGLLGAGDAKYAAVMAPFIAVADLGSFAFMFAAVILLGFIFHRTAKRIGFIRRATPNWESWERDDFPMGLCLGTMMVLYLVWAGLTGQ